MYSTILHDESNICNDCCKPERGEFLLHKEKDQKIESFSVFPQPLDIVYFHDSFKNFGLTYHKSILRTKNKVKPAKTSKKDFLKKSFLHIKYIISSNLP